VVTYDYRGIGGSLPAGIRVRDFKGTMMDWARLDAQGALDWVLQEFPGARLSAVGHSFGGQVLGMLENGDKIERVLMVASQMGYWRNFAPKHRPAMLLYWYLAFPVFLATLGYIPMRRFKAGEDLPGGVARQWRDWCIHPEYLFSELDEKGKESFRRFAAPILAYGFTDDSFAGGQSVERLLERYSGAQSRLRKVSPKELGVPGIGHFGFFRSRFRETLWQQAWDWLAEGQVSSSTATESG